MTGIMSLITIIQRYIIFGLGIQVSFCCTMNLKFYHKLKSKILLN